MAALTTAQEYELVREAIQTLTATGQQTVSFTLGAMSKTFNASQMPQLMDREKELARRLGQRNIRKRTLGDYS